MGSESSNKYLAEFNKIDESPLSKEFKRKFKAASRSFRGGKTSTSMERVSSYEPKGGPPKIYLGKEGEVIAEAKRLIRDGIERGNITEALYGARAYEKAGLADRHSVVDGLLRAYRSAWEHRPEDAQRYRGEVEDFIKVHGEAAAKRIRVLEKKVAASTAVITFAAGLFFLSANLTGNVISNLNQTSSNWIGGILFAIGLIGAFAYFKIR